MTAHKRPTRGRVPKLCQPRLLPAGPTSLRGCLTRKADRSPCVPIPLILLCGLSAAWLQTRQRRGAVQLRTSQPLCHNALGQQNGSPFVPPRDRIMIHAFLVPCISDASVKTCCIRRQSPESPLLFTLLSLDFRISAGGSSPNRCSGEPARYRSTRAAMLEQTAS